MGGDEQIMKLWMVIAMGIGLALAYFLIPPVFWLCILILIVYVVYRLYRLLERWMTPQGKRIRHGALKGHLEKNYGTREGSRLYKEMVGELRKKGYR